MTLPLVTWRVFVYRASCHSKASDQYVKYTSRIPMSQEYYLVLREQKSALMKLVSIYVAKIHYGPATNVNSLR